MKKFFVLWVGELISTIGSGLTAFGLGVYVYRQTGMASATALVSLLALLPTVILGPVAGVLADRYDRRFMMILGDSLSALGLFYILFCVRHGGAQLWQICLGVTISSVFASLLEPSYRATITDLIPEENYSKAIGLVQIAGSAKFLISPFIAGFLMKTSGIETILWIDVCTFFVTVTATISVARTVKKKETVTERESFIKELGEGFQVIAKNRGVLILVVLSSGVCLFLTLIQTLCTPMVIAFSDEATLGVCETICACGMLVSSIILGTVSIKKGYVRLLSLSFFALGFFMIFFGFKENIVLITIAGFLFFMGLPFANTALDVLVRKNIPNEVQGRTWGIISLISQMGYVVGNALIGVLADNVFEPAMAEGGALSTTVGAVIGTGVGRGSALLIIIGGFCLCILAPIVYGNKSIRSLEA